MTEAQNDRIHELQEFLYIELHDVVDAALLFENQEVQNAVREHMNEQFRFWKRT